jgi:hypothetical protein
METEYEVVEEKEVPISGIQAKGFFHLQLEEDGEIVGDSGWVPNLVTRHGFNHICLLTGTALTGTQFSHLNVGTGGAPATNATSLTNEVTGQSSPGPRQTATASTTDSVTLRFVGTMSSSNSFVTQSENISNVGIFNHSTGSSLCAGAVYTSSTVATNQNVNITYDLVFETA